MDPGPVSSITVAQFVVTVVQTGNNGTVFKGRAGNIPSLLLITHCLMPYTLTKNMQKKKHNTKKKDYYVDGCLFHPEAAMCRFIFLNLI